MRLDNDIDPVVYDHLADALVRAGLIDEALTHYQKVRKMLDESAMQPYSTEHALLDETVDAKIRAIIDKRPVPVADIVPLPRQHEQQQADPRKRKTSQSVTGEM